MHYQPLSTASELIDLTDCEEFTGTEAEVEVAREMLMAPKGSKGLKIKGQTAPNVVIKKEPSLSTSSSPPNPNPIDGLLDLLMEGIRQRLTVTSTASSSGLKRDTPPMKGDKMDEN